MKQTKKSLRLRYFIKSGMQLKFLRVNILLALFISLVIAFSVYQLSINILGTSLEEVYPPGLLNNIYKNLDSALAIRLLFTILVIIIATFLITHRVAGPAYHIERDLSNMAEGDLTKRIYLRKYDELIPIATKLNAMADYIGRNLNSINSKLEAMEKLCEQLKSGELNPSACRDISTKLTASLQGAKDALSKFRV
jgi:methyl-accepting chemotaxis protein